MVKKRAQKQTKFKINRKSISIIGEQGTVNFDGKRFKAKIPIAGGLNVNFSKSIGKIVGVFGKP